MNGKSMNNCTTCQFSNYSMNPSFFFFFFLSTVVNSSSLLVRHVTFVTRGIIMVDSNCYEQLVKWLRIDERRNCESS